MTEHVRFEAETDPACGCRPQERDTETMLRFGLVVLDKPAGLTSREACDQVRRLLGAAKAGHGGTLDPQVTGVLPVLLEHSTRTAQVFLGCDKTYEGTMTLHGDVGDEALETAVEHFRGVITQLPPRRSRVKRQEREREIYRFRIEERDRRQVRFLVECEGGTYIRKLVHDLGQELGCGAHMSSLRRTRSAGFDQDETVSTEQVAAAAHEGTAAALRNVVLPVEAGLARLLPRVWIADGAVEPVCTGYPLAVPGIARLEDYERGDPLAVLTLKGELVGIGRALLSSGEVLNASAGLAVRVRQVRMQTGTYEAAKNGA